MRNAKKKGVSPVIATVILVAIAIMISIAAAFWMTGLLSSFTAYEHITLSATIAKDKATGKYNVTIIVANEGTLTANVTRILINGTVQSDRFTPTPPVLIPPGTTQTFTTASGKLFTFAAGRPVRITVVTSKGSYETEQRAP